MATSSLSSLGVGSGLDLEGLITKLMTAEQKPLAALQKKQAATLARISALGSLKSAIASLQTSAVALSPASGQSLDAKYATFGASVADSSVAGASAATGAVAGRYALEVTALAQSQRLVSPKTAGYTSSTSPLAASGTLKIELGSTTGGSFDSKSSVEVVVTAGQTLGDLRDAINAANGGVTATLMTSRDTNGVSSTQLVVTSNQTGSDSVMKMSGLAGFDFDPDNASTGALSQAVVDGGQAAQNAAFTLNGIASTSTSNTVTGVLDGVTLTLNKTNAGSPTMVTITKDTNTKLTAQINAFVKAFNDTRSTTSQLGNYDAATQKSGALQGESTLRSAQNAISRLSTTAVAGATSYRMLADIGVTLQKDGTMAVDATKLSAALADDTAAVTKLVMTVGDAFNKGLETIVGSDGSIKAATDSSERISKATINQATQLQARLVTIEARYRAQFTALDGLLAKLSQTSTYLTQQLANLPKISSSK